MACTLACEHSGSLHESYFCWLHLMCFGYATTMIRRSYWCMDGERLHVAQPETATLPVSLIDITNSRLFEPAPKSTASILPYAHVRHRRINPSVFSYRGNSSSSLLLYHIRFLTARSCLKALIKALMTDGPNLALNLCHCARFRHR